MQGEARKLQSSLVGLPIQERKKQLARYMSDMNQLGAGKLAEYVVHRRAVLDFLADCMKVGPDRKYRNEDVIHEVIFPRKVSSDDVPDVNETNLWIVDERLAYHVYLASDMEWRRSPIAVEEESGKDRADVLVLMPFDTPHAFVDCSPTTPQACQYTSMTIVELKKPMRDDYDPETRRKNPVTQVLGYIKTVRGGTAKDKDGQIIELHPNAPIYAYLICTVTKKLKSIVEEREFKPTPDGLGYYRYHDNYRAYIEVIPYNKLLADARKRNEVFFDKIGLPTSAFDNRQRAGS